MDLVHLHPMEGKALTHRLLKEGMDQGHHYFLVDKVPIPRKFQHLAQLDFQMAHLFHLLRNNQVDEPLES